MSALAKERKDNNLLNTYHFLTPAHCCLSHHFLAQSLGKEKVTLKTEVIHESRWASGDIPTGAPQTRCLPGNSGILTDLGYSGKDEYTFCR